MCIINRIEVARKIEDARANSLRKTIQGRGFAVKDVTLLDVFTVDKELQPSKSEEAASVLYNKETQSVAIDQPAVQGNFDWAIEIHFLPGVTDNAGTTARESIEDKLKTKFSPEEGVYSSRLIFTSGDISREDATAIGWEFANPVIESVRIKDLPQFKKDGGMGVYVPKVRLPSKPAADVVDILNADDIELKRIGKMGVFDFSRELTEKEYVDLRLAYAKNELMLGDIFEDDGKYYQKVRRGPLALDLICMKEIQRYFRENEGRNPFDVELESIAQTWSEHCKHTIFADPIDSIGRGLYETYIKAATQLIRMAKGKDDICVSVFTDNAGVIRFDEEHNICAKAETHNSPSALDPFGGAITGIVGVNRDPMGTGQGAKNIINLPGPYCFADPFKEIILYKGPNNTQKMLIAKRIMDGVIDGVRVGGNCSGIPSPWLDGSFVFDERYRGKPLVFVGTIGIMPRYINGQPSHEKAAMPGDLIVMAGGRVGKDGIHGATFSSESLHQGSPAGAVQIGDPITQKKLHDAQLEARDLGLYNSVTDNGAGGLSCSVAEMAKECGGCEVELEKVPTKYTGIKPNEIWISESQERMTYAVPKEKIGQFLPLMTRRGVEATVIGEFNDSRRCVVKQDDKTIMDISMEFLHDGVPQRPMKTRYTKKAHEEPSIEVLDRHAASLETMIGRLNLASAEFVAEQYDHEVQGGSVLKPLQGKGRVNGDAAVYRPVLDSMKGVVIARGINPTYSDIDTYHMAACAIDTAIRNAVAAGANLDHLAILDNFCWSSSDDPERLGQLKEACRACYDIAVSYLVPFVSGKDSMFNDFKGFDDKGNPVKISVPPTLMVTAVGVMNDSRKAVSIDPKFEGDFVYVLGETHDELGGSEYFAMIGEKETGGAFIGNNVPKVDPNKNSKMYRALYQCIEEGIIASSKSVTRGGLRTALEKKAMAGKLGMDISLEDLPGTATRDDFRLYSESMGRIVITINPGNEGRFNQIMQENGVMQNSYAKIGVVREDKSFVVKGADGKEIINANIDSMLEKYRETFEGF